MDDVSQLICLEDGDLDFGYTRLHRHAAHLYFFTLLGAYGSGPQGAPPLGSWVQINLTWHMGGCIVLQCTGPA